MPWSQPTDTLCGVRIRKQAFGINQASIELLAGSQEEATGRKRFMHGTLAYFIYNGDDSIDNVEHQLCNRKGK